MRKTLVIATQNHQPGTVSVGGGMLRDQIIWQVVIKIGKVHDKKGHLSNRESYTIQVIQFTTQDKKAKGKNPKPSASRFLSSSGGKRMLLYPNVRLCVHTVFVEYGIHRRQVFLGQGPTQCAHIQFNFLRCTRSHQGRADHRIC